MTEHRSEDSSASETFQQAFSQAGAKLRRGENGEVDVMHAVGGIRGILEALLPGFSFLLVFLFSGQLYLSLILALAFSLIFALVRLLQRGQLVQSFSGFVGVALCAIVAIKTGQAADYYLFGLWTNAAYALGLLLSLVLRFPLLGLIYSFLRDEVGTWKQEPARYRAYRNATWALLGMFAARLLVQVPLYLADNVAGLGICRLLMGLPLYAAVLWFTWLMTRKPAELEQKEN